MSTYQRNEYYVLRITNKDRNNTLVNPTSMKASIIDPCNHMLVNWSDMTNESTGQYFYNYPITSIATYGKYIVKAKAVSASSVTAIHESKFYVLPWNANQDVRQTMGISTNDNTINDDDIDNAIWNAYCFGLQQVYEHHFHETPQGNPDTGTFLDGSNTLFQTNTYPIADKNWDGMVCGTTSCATDVSMYYIDENGYRYEGKVTVKNALNGEVYLYQSNGVTALPSSTQKVHLDYWSESPNYDEHLFQQAVVRLACHEISIRMSTIDRITLADIKSNNPLIMLNPKRYMDEYQRYLSMINESITGGVKAYLE